MTYIYNVDLKDNLLFIDDKNSSSAKKSSQMSSFMVTKPDKNEDMFVRTTPQEPQVANFIASDGRKYNIYENLSQRIMMAAYTYDEYTNSDNEIKNYFDLFKSALGIKSNESKTKDLLESAKNFISSGTNIENYFEELTGKPYNRKNIELFLRRQIKLKAEIAIEDFTSSKIQDIEPAPIYETTIFDRKIQDKKTSLNKSDKEKYQALSTTLDNNYKEKIEKVLKSGKLLLKDSNNNTVLDSLYSMLTNDRVAGIDNEKLIKEAIDILDNPFIITQSPANIPEKYQTELIEIIMKEQGMDKETASAFLNNDTSGTCAAAALEYELATEHIAEFFRMVESITSKEYSFDKDVLYTSIADDKKSAIELLKKNNTEYQEKNDNTVTVTLRPDKNAIIRARIQNYYHDAGERSMIDVLVQSTIMNFGSRGTYDGLSDTRQSNETYPGNGGLAPDEVLYTQSILTDGQSKVNIYQNINSAEWKLDGRNQTIEETKNQIIKMLQEGKNVVIGMSITDENGNIISGHETTIVGYTQNLNNEKFFILKDSGENSDIPMNVNEDWLLDKIQHSISKN